MAKPEIEFCDPEVKFEWRPVEGGVPGIYEKILSRDPETGNYTRLLKFLPGVRTSEVLIHDFWEEVLILKGELVDLSKDETYGEGFYACRPPGDEARAVLRPAGLYHLRDPLL